MKEPWLKIEADIDEIRVQAQGDVNEITSLFAQSINNMYRTMKEKRAFTGIVFKELLTAFFTEDDSPLWNESEDENVDAVYEIKK